MAIAEIKHLKKVYPTFTLTDVSFYLNAGRITRFLGRNGSGTTTTINKTTHWIFYWCNQLLSEEKD